MFPLHAFFPVDMGSARTSSCSLRQPPQLPCAPAECHCQRQGSGPAMPRRTHHSQLHTTPKHAPHFRADGTSRTGDAHLHRPRARGGTAVISSCRDHQLHPSCNLTCLCAAKRMRHLCVRFQISLLVSACSASKYFIPVHLNDNQWQGALNGFGEGGERPEHVL